MLKSVTIMNIPEGMKFSFNVLSNEEDKESSKGFEVVGAGFNDEDAEHITPSMMTNEEKREEFIRLMAMIQPRINMPPFHGYSEDLDEDKDPFIWGDPDYKPKEEIEGLSTEVDYYLIKNVINSDNPDAKKIAVYLKEMTEQKLTKLMKPYCVKSFDFDITEENEDHFIQWIVARTYFSGLENSNRFYLANQVTNTLTIEAIFYNIHIIEGDYEKTNARFERIKHKVTEHVLTLMHLDEFINS